MTEGQTLPAIEYRDVTVRFSHDRGAIVALDSVSFQVPRGCFTSVIGPSGCGKTTLLRLCSGLDQVSSGEALCNGERVRGLNRAVGYITQDSNLFPWMTVRQTVEFPLEVRGVPRTERHERSDRYLRTVGLAGFEDHYPYQLSGGMQKRASIVRTLIYEPETVLMDEPFGALDSQTRMALQADLLKMWSAREQTILFITHDLAEAISLSDQIVVLSQRPGTVKQVFEVPLARPRDIFAIQGEPGFAEAYNSIWHALRSDVLASVGETQQRERPPHPARPAATPSPAAETPAARVTAPARPALFLTRLRNSVILFRLVLLLAFLAAWEILADTHVVDPLIFSHPLGVLDTLRSLLAGEAISGGSIYDEIKVTVGEMATGFLIGSVAAIALGFYLGRSRFLARVLQPFILASYGVPIIAIAPIFILVLGIGYPSKIGIATITSFFVVFFQTFAGVGAVPEELPQLARIMGASGPRIVRQVLIPASLPFIFAGLRMAVPFSMTGAVIGEFVASSSGLGWYIVRAAGAFDAAGLFAGLILMLVIVWVLGLVVAAVERRLLRWQPRREAPSGRAS